MNSNTQPQTVQLDTTIATWHQGLPLSHQKEFSLLILKEASSTQDVAKTSNFTTPLALVIAHHQTQGRGRYDRIWEDKPGSSFLGTFKFQYFGALSPVLSMRLGLQLIQALELAFGDLGFSLKAPNDVYLGEKKLAGMLLEVTSSSPQQHQLFWGIGINLFQPTYPSAAFLQESVPAERIHLALPKVLNSILEFLRSFQGDSPCLAPNECLDLQKYLNKNQLFGDLTEVTPQGSLVCKNRTVQWNEL